jgi:hypothetical protein
MSSIGICLCDICGKRMPQGKEGNLVLQTQLRTKYSNGMKTQRNWACCKSCFQKLIGLRTKGDFVKEDIETIIDEHCGKREKKILTNKKKKAIEIMEVFE